MNDQCLDKIHIRDLHTRCIVGIFPEEREKSQEISIDITLFADLRKACQTDCIDDTVDYKKIKQQVLELVENSAFFLLEKLAEEIAAVCLKAKGVEQVDVTVDKPGALRFAKSVAVEISRKKMGA